MTHWVSQHLSYYFAHYGYWTVLVGLLLENAGIPLPGETILITASVLARTEHRLNIAFVGIVAVVAAVTGDNLGFALGRYAGCPLLERYRDLFHIKQETIREGERLIERRGGMAVFFARFIAGLRVLAGPLAGILKMRWARFLFFNALGALAWVAAIATAAYLLGPEIEILLRHATLAIAIVVVGGMVLWWWKRERSASQKG